VLSVVLHADHAGVVFTGPYSSQRQAMNHAALAVANGGVAICLPLALQTEWHAGPPPGVRLPNLPALLDRLTHVQAQDRGPAGVLAVNTYTGQITALGPFRRPALARAWIADHRLPWVRLEILALLDQPRASADGPRLVRLAERAGDRMVHFGPFQDAAQAVCWLATMTQRFPAIQWRARLLRLTPPDDIGQLPPG
jgi:hypothetical protein